MSYSGINFRKEQNWTQSIKWETFKHNMTEPCKFAKLFPQLAPKKILHNLKKKWTLYNSLSIN